MKKLVSLILALCMILTLSFSLAEDAEEWSAQQYEEHADMRTALESDYSGKTVILHSNDVHGEIDGYACIAGLRTVFENLGAKVLLVDAGDFSQGTVYVIATKGEAAITMMNAAKYDVVTLGNHEFDFGYEQLMENLSKAEFTALCGNVYLDETGEAILPATTVMEVDGVKIGFFGLNTPETATKVNPGLIKEISFSAFDKLYEAGQKAVDELAEADLKIGILHLGMDLESKMNGYRSVDLLNKVSGIDFVIDGHSHYLMTAAQTGEPIQSTGTKFQSVGVIVIDNETKKIEDHFLLPVSPDKDPLYSMRLKVSDAEVEEAAVKIHDEVDSEYSAVFASSEVLLDGSKAASRTQETNLGDLITDALVWSVVKEGGIEQTDLFHVVGITNGGGIRATLEPGELTKKDINTVLPFGNTVAVVYVTGSELLEALEASTFCTPESIGGFPQTSGITWTLDTTREFEKGDVYTLDGKETSYFAPASINRVTISKINGEDFDPDAVYAVVTNNFCAVGGDTYNVFARSSSSFDTGIPMDEAVMAFVSEVLDGKITEEAYGVPQGRETEIK